MSYNSGPFQDCFEMSLVPSGIFEIGSSYKFLNVCGLKLEDIFSSRPNDTPNMRSMDIYLITVKFSFRILCGSCRFWPESKQFNFRVYKITQIMHDISFFTSINKTNSLLSYLRIRFVRESK